MVNIHKPYILMHVMRDWTSTSQEHIYLLPFGINIHRLEKLRNLEEPPNNSES